MQVHTTEIEGCLIIEPDCFGDNRGFFMELYRDTRYIELGISETFSQDNFSRSCQGTLRGLHYQLTKPQGKLVQVVQGEVFDVAVDLRKSSPSFGKWFGISLTAENHKQLYVPPGCAHGFYVQSESTDFLYKCTQNYDAADERVLAWDDPKIGIKWPLEGSPILSPKDLAGTPFAEADLYD